MELLIWKDDDDTLIYEFETGDQRAEAICHILQTRIKGQFFEGDDEDQAKALLQQVHLTGVYHDAYHFLIQRSNEGYEYEFIYTDSTVRV